MNFIHVIIFNLWSFENEYITLTTFSIKKQYFNVECIDK